MDNTKNSLRSKEWSWEIDGAEVAIRNRRSNGIEVEAMLLSQQSLSLSLSHTHTRSRAHAQSVQ
jgi:hypothetical protein